MRRVNNMFPNILEKIRKYAIDYPEYTALVNPNSNPKQLTYKELFL